MLRFVALNDQRGRCPFAQIHPFLQFADGINVGYHGRSDRFPPKRHLNFDVSHFIEHCVIVEFANTKPKCYKDPLLGKYRPAVGIVIGRCKHFQWICHGKLLVFPHEGKVKK